MAEADKHITYTLADIQRYLQGGMTAREMHDLERAALEDPFLADALEGYREADLLQAQTHLTQIEKAIQQPQQQGKVVPLPRIKKYQSWQVAAAVVLLACIGTVSFFIYFKKANNAMLAKNESNTMLQQDSVQRRVQQVVPPVNDTATIKTDSAEKAPAAKEQPLLAKNKNRIASKKQSSAAQVSASMTAIIDDNDTAALNANSAMTLRAPANVVTGTITDNKQQPVPNAKIILQDSTVAVTDRNGNFRIATTDSMAIGSISALGYKPLQKQSLKRGYNSIVLKERPFLLSDVEVINIGTADKKITDTTATMPEGGWQSFREYVYNKLQKQYDTTLTNAYIDSDLQLEFSINDFGEPTDFKVLYAPDVQTANEAISAIKTGPRWTTGDKKNKLRITFRYK